MIKVFVGSHTPFKAAEAACINSIIANTTSAVEIQFIRPDDLGIAPQGCTGFSLLRYMVPEIAEHRGFAIYLDVDMILLGDIAELFEYRQAGKWVVMENGDDEVAVIDCTAFTGFPSYKNLKGLRRSDLKPMCKQVPVIPSVWNVEDSITDDAKLLHFTDLKCQPWMAKPEYRHPCPDAVAVWECYS